MRKRVLPSIASPCFLENSVPAAGRVVGSTSCLEKQEASVAKLSQEQGVRASEASSAGSASFTFPSLHSFRLKQLHFSEPLTLAP